LLEIAEDINVIQKKHHVPLQKEDADDEFNFGLMEVVFEWARGLVRTLLITSLCSYLQVCSLVLLLGIHSNF